jgi:hypothetical protein
MFLPSRLSTIGIVKQNVEFQARLRVIIMANPILMPIYEYSATEPVLRFFYSNQPDAGLGWKRDRIAFFAFGQDQPGVVRVLRYTAANPQRYQYSTNPNLGQGWVNEGTAFYAFTTDQTFTIPVYQYAATNPQRYRYSTNPNLNMGAGWKNEGKAFRVFAAQPA